MSNPARYALSNIFWHILKISVRVGLPVACDLLRALTVLSAAGVLHGDIKPENVLLEKTEQGPRGVLCDFGLATVLYTSQPLPLYTLTYRPPHVCTSVDRVQTDPGMDLWAAGMVLADIYAGYPVLRASTHSLSLHLWRAHRLFRHPAQGGLDSNAHKWRPATCWPQEPDEMLWRLACEATFSRYHYSKTTAAFEVPEPTAEHLLNSCKRSL